MWKSASETALLQDRLIYLDRDRCDRLDGHRMTVGLFNCVKKSLALSRLPDHKSTKLIMSFINIQRIITQRSMGAYPMWVSL